MSTPSIRATLERLVELHDAEAAWGLHWDEAIDAAHAALAQPEGEGPSAADLLPANPPNIPTTMALRCRSAWYEGVEDGWNEARAILARCGRPTALPAPEVREGPILQWTENMPPSEDCRYDHCTAETLFGRFLITWKSWKQFDGPTVDETPWGDWYGAFNSVDAAKAACQRGMDERLARWGRPAAPPAPEVGAALADLENLELAFESSFECKVRTSRIRPALLHYATLLQQQAAPAPAVVPVSERPWDQEGWCDERGYCWRFDPCPDGWWSYGRPTNFTGDHEECWTHMAPHNAIPLPQAGEVEA